MLFRSMKVQLMFIATLPLLLVIIALVSFMSYQNKQVLEEQMAGSGETLLQQVALMAELPLYSRNISALSEIADVMIKIDDIEYIKFTDPTGNFLAERGARDKEDKIDIFSRTVRDSSSFALDDFDEMDDDIQQGTVLGHIQIGISRSQLIQKLEKGYSLLLLVSVVSLFVGLLLIYLFTRKARKALTSLFNAASAIKKAEYSTYSEENGSGELLLFQRTFNEMIDSLQRSDQESREKIQQATAALADLVNQLEIKNKELELTKKEALKLERSKAIEEERSRIMRDMHDGVGGQLVASLSMIDLEPESESKRNIQATLSECLDDFRLIINSLDSQANTLSTVLATFKYRISKKLKKCNISMKWDVTNLKDDVIIEPQQSLHVLRIIQEAFTNILKHANATEITFSAISGQKTITITIEDNGTTAGQFILNKGHGIKNMQWRANELGANISFDHLPNQGTKVSLIIGVSH